MVLHGVTSRIRDVLEHSTVCCSVLQCVAVCCSVLQCVAVCCSMMKRMAACCSTLQRVAALCSVVHCSPVCCSVRLHIKNLPLLVDSKNTPESECIAVYCNVLQCFALCPVRATLNAVCCVKTASIQKKKHYAAIHCNTLQHTATHCQDIFVVPEVR